jgi:hypothetical protein
MDRVSFVPMRDRGRLLSPEFDELMSSVGPVYFGGTVSVHFGSSSKRLDNPRIGYLLHAIRIGYVFRDVHGGVPVPGIWRLQKEAREAIEAWALSVPELDTEDGSLRYLIKEEP